MTDPGPAFRAVLFDMDGVLCDSEAFIAAAAIRMFREDHGVAVRAEDFLPFVGAGENRYLGGVAEKHGVVLAMPRDKVRTYERYLEDIRGRLHPIPGAAEFLSACRARGLRTAVASSADRLKVDGNLREIGFPPATFDAIVTGSDIRHPKPDPEIFLAAAARVGVEPAACLVVEDAINGVVAARRAGCHCLGVTSSFPAALLRESGAEWTCEKLDQALHLLPSTINH
jgi:HAD superfamily hydrolase (TIGR01509 family)